MLKKIFVSIIFFMLFFLISSCNNNINNVDNKTIAQNNKIKIVTTIYPEYDWVNNIIKNNEEKFDLSILMTSGVDLHNFQPSAKDILDIGKADLFIYVGGESDKWVDRAIKQVTNKNFQSINLMEILKDNVKIEELKEGMEDEHDHAHDSDEEHEDEVHEGEEHDEEHEEVEYDEHVWLSLKNAIIVCKVIEDKISQLDLDNKELYKKNLDEYLGQLEELDKNYAKTINSAKRKILIFGDRFPFRYMFDDYGLDYYAAFKGCAAETEASFKTIKFLADKLSEEQLPYVMKIEKSDEKIARAVIENSDNNNAQIETLYSIQSVSSDDIANGMTYIAYMQKNLDILKKVLN